MAASGAPVGGIWGAVAGGFEELKNNASGFRLDEALLSKELRANKLAR